MSSIFIRGKDTLWSRFVELRQRRREWDKRRRRVRRKSRIKHKILLVNLKTVSMSWRETRRRVKVCLGWKKYTQFQWEWLDSHCFPTCSSCCDLRYNNRKFNWGGEDFIFYYFNLHFTYLFSFSTFSGIFHSFYIIRLETSGKDNELCCLQTLFCSYFVPLHTILAMNEQQQEQCRMCEQKNKKEYLESGSSTRHQIIKNPVSISFLCIFIHTENYWVKSKLVQ